MKINQQQLDKALKHHGINGVHKACQNLPWLNDKEAQTLCDAIRKNGLRNDISITESRMLVDGRHRLVFCHEHAITPRFRIIQGDDSEIWLLVWQQNFAKRGAVTEAQKKYFLKKKKESKEREQQRLF